MNVRSLARAEPFVTKDGSTIRELHHTQAQSLAEATLEPAQATERHYHRASEEIYLVTNAASAGGGATGARRKTAEPPMASPLGARGSSSSTGRSGASAPATPSSSRRAPGTRSTTTGRAS